MQPNQPIKFKFDTVFGSKGATTHSRSSYTSDEVEAIESPPAEAE